MTSRLPNWLNCGTGNPTAGPAVGAELIKVEVNPGLPKDTFRPPKGADVIRQ
jgi:hypothetical protein